MKYIQALAYLLPIVVLGMFIFEIYIPDFLRSMGLVMAVVALSKSLYEILVKKDE